MRTPTTEGEAAIRFLKWAVTIGVTLLYAAGFFASSGCTEHDGGRTTLPAPVSPLAFSPPVDPPAGFTPRFAPQSLPPPPGGCDDWVSDSEPGIVFSGAGGDLSMHYTATLTTPDGREWEREGAGTLLRRSHRFDRVKQSNPDPRRRLRDGAAILTLARREPSPERDRLLHGCEYHITANGRLGSAITTSAGPGDTETPPPPPTCDDLSRLPVGEGPPPPVWFSSVSFEQDGYFVRWDFPNSIERTWRVTHFTRQTDESDTTEKTICTDEIGFLLAHHADGLEVRSGPYCFYADGEEGTIIPVPHGEGCYAPQEDQE